MLGPDSRSRITLRRARHAQADLPDAPPPATAPVSASAPASPPAPVLTAMQQPLMESASPTAQQRQPREGHVTVESPWRPPPPQLPQSSGAPHHRRRSLGRPGGGGGGPADSSVVIGAPRPAAARTRVRESQQPLWVSGRAWTPAVRATQTWSSIGDISSAGTTLSPPSHHLQSQPLQVQPDKQLLEPHRPQESLHNAPLQHEPQVELQSRTGSLQPSGNPPVCAYDAVELTVSALEALAFEREPSPEELRARAAAGSACDSGPQLWRQSQSTATVDPTGSVGITGQTGGDDPREAVGCADSGVLALSSPSLARVDVILSTLRANVGDPRATEGAIALLRALAASSHSVRHAIGTREGVPPVVDSLNRFTGVDEAVTGQSLMAVANIAFDNMQNKNLLLEADALHSIVAAMNAYMESSPHVVTFGCLAIRNIVFGAAAVASSQVLKSDAPAVIARALQMAVVTKHSKMALQAMQALTNIVTGHDSPDSPPLFKPQALVDSEAPNGVALIKIRIRSSGCIETLVDSLTTFGHSPIVLDACLACLTCVLHASPANAACFGEVRDGIGIEHLLELVRTAEVVRTYSLMTKSTSGSSGNADRSRSGSVFSGSTTSGSIVHAVDGEDPIGSAQSGPFRPSSEVRSSPVKTPDSLSHDTLRDEVRQHILHRGQGGPGHQEQQGHDPSQPEGSSQGELLGLHQSLVQNESSRSKNLWRRRARSGLSFAPSTSSADSSSTVSDIGAHIANVGHAVGEAIASERKSFPLGDHFREALARDGDERDFTNVNGHGETFNSGGEFQNPDLQVLCRGAELLHLLALAHPNRQAIIAHQGIALMVGMIRELSWSARCAPAAMLALWRCVVGSSSAAAQACIANAAPTIVEVMQLHRHRRSVQRLGLALLVVLTELNDGNRHTACSAGAVGAVFFALTEHARSEDVVAHSCRFFVLLSPLNILASGIDLISLARVVALRRSRHASSSLVEKATRDLLEAIELIPGDVAKIASMSMTGMASADFFVGPDGDMRDAARTGRASSFGPFFDPASMRSGDMARSASPMSPVYHSGKGEPGMSHRPGGRPSLARSSRLLMSLGLSGRRMAAFRADSRDASGSVAVAGFSSRWRSDDLNASSGSSCFSGRASRRGPRRRMPSSYSNATQFVAMRPLLVTLKEAREQEAAVQASIEDDVETGVVHDAGDLWSDFSGAGSGSLRGAHGPPSSPAGSTALGRHHSDLGMTDSRRAELGASSFLQSGSERSESSRSMSDGASPLLVARSQGLNSPDAVRHVPGQITENRVRELLFKGEYDNQPLPHLASPLVGASMSNAGASRRPDISRFKHSDHISVGSGRRGESGSLSQHSVRRSAESPSIESASVDSSPDSAAASGVTYKDLDDASL